MILALTVSLFPSCGSDNLTEKGQKENDTKQLDLLKKDDSVAVNLSKKDGIETDFACFGHYLYDKKLSGNWVFKAFENKRIEELGINQIPLVCIDVNTRSFSGSGGNHMIYGDLRCEGESITFKIVLSPDYVSLSESKEKELLEILEECDRYELDEDDLNLFIGEELKLQFFRDTYNV